MLYFQSVRYEEGTDGYENFIKSDSPTYQQIWVFNLSNYDEVMDSAKAAIPSVEQIGPYTYL